MSLTTPLAGVRVLTFEGFGAGPYGSMHLADLGAEVIKIENRSQGGDASRGMGPHFLGDNDSHYFKHPLGRKAFHRLAATADAVLNNLRGDQPEKLGLTYAALKSANPKIVCAHISAYGRDNERKSWPGYDYLMQAEAGFFHLTGEPDTPPTRVGLSMIDFMTGTTASLALTAALLSVARTGVGGDIDVSLFDVALHQLSYPGSWYLNEGQLTTRQPRSAHPSAVPVQLYKTRDGWIFIMCMTEKFWQELMRALEQPDLAADPRFATLALRRRNREALTPILDEALSRDTTANWIVKLGGRLPAAPVHDMAGALENPFLQRTGMVRNTPHPARSNFRTLANPIKLDGQRLPSKVCSALGADTDDLLRGVGLTEQELTELHAAGAA
jgi:crotonobetainyl-CoA:carnitine CoA-transferase CaiB-like acyl-CoA transferase